MPFTLSHAVVAAPLHYVSGQRLPYAAIVIGSMAPDLHRLFTTNTSNATHEWQHIFNLTLWIGLAFCLLWYGLFRPFIYRCLGLQDPIHLPNLKTALIFIFTLMLGVVMGICTHLIWDGLTHDDFRTFIFHDALRQEITLFSHSYPLHRILQLLSSALTLPFLIWMCIVYYQRHKTLNVPRQTKRYAILSLLLSVFIGLGSSLHYAFNLSIFAWQNELYYHSGRSINEFFQGFLFSFSFAAVVFWVLRKKEIFH